VQCGNKTNAYKHIKHVCPLRRHNTPGEPMISATKIPNIREGPMLGHCAVLKRFHNAGYDPNDTLIVFYPSGLNSVNFAIYGTFLKLGYEVVVCYWDSSTGSYF
jgi:hypothetical protein